jgi:DNA-binding NarL/FixJ family response regulator
MSGEAVRVLIADDHPMFRDGIRLVFSVEPAIELVGEAADGLEVVDLAADLQPDVVVMDLHLPGRNGIDATREVVTTSPHIGVLVLTMFDDDESVFRAMRAGARGFLLKGAGHEELVRALLTVADGGVILGRRVAQRMQRFFESPPPAVSFPGLTAREHEVLDLVAQGRSNPEIAARSRSRARRSATTCRTCSPSCRWPIAPRPSWPPDRPGWAARASRSPRRRTRRAQAPIQPSTTPSSGLRSSPGST